MSYNIIYIMAMVRSKGTKVPPGICSKQGVLRPTSSKVRESIFNILSEKIKESVFADLYAGTGAVGMEAMSRGAGKVFFVEANKKRAGAIEQTLSGCGCRSRAVIVKRKAMDFMTKVCDRFDIVFVDPPYYSDEMDRLLPVLGEGEMLSEDAVVIAEHRSKKTLPDEVGRLIKKKQYKYGDTMLTLFRKVQ